MENLKKFDIVMWWEVKKDFLSVICMNEKSRELCKYVGKI